MAILLHKMQTNYKNTQVEYYLEIDGKQIVLNNFLGKKIKIAFTGVCNCIECGAETKKLYGEGLCYQCFQMSPLAEECILHPEKCQAHIGVARDMHWAREHCLIPHYVYLAKTNQIKVGVTRQSQVPTRWIDQGADFAIKMLKVPYRQIAGEIEVFLKQHFSDKTQWQAMLRNETCDIDLLLQKKNALDLLNEQWKDYAVLYDYVYEFKYPYIEVPKELERVNLLEDKLLEGRLTAIKGQYIIVDNRKVLNIRSHSGLNVEFDL